jgi:hypothetical protein
VVLLRQFGGLSFCFNQFSPQPFDFRFHFNHFFIPVFSLSVMLFLQFFLIYPPFRIKLLQFRLPNVLNISGNERQ